MPASLGHVAELHMIRIDHVAATPQRNPILIFCAPPLGDPGALSRLPPSCAPPNSTAYSPCPRIPATPPQSVPEPRRRLCRSDRRTAATRISNRYRRVRELRSSISTRMLTKSPWSPLLMRIAPCNAFPFTISSAPPISALGIFNFAACGNLFARSSFVLTRQQRSYNVLSFYCMGWA